MPAIALSAGTNAGGEELANPLSPQVAQRTLELIAALEERARSGAPLPRGFALNVNFPDQLDGAQWRVTQIGSYYAYKIVLAASMAESASPGNAGRRGAGIPSLPGTSFGINDAPPCVEQANDESVVFRRHISVSPMQAGYAVGAPGADFVRWQLADLVTQGAEDKYRP